MIACEPLKIQEYLAVGKPVVVTDFPAMHRFKSVVSIATNHQMFISHVQQYINGNDAVGIDKRKESVKDSGWDVQAHHLERLLYE